MMLPKLHEKLKEDRFTLLEKKLKGFKEEIKLLEEKSRVARVKRERIYNTSKNKYIEAWLTNSNGGNLEDSDVSVLK